MANGTPIRLIQRNGGIIELNVTTVTMDVDRKFNPKPLVYSGSHRVATDSNLTRAVIQLEGVMTDDDAVFVSSSTQASASIDFSYTVESRRKGGRKITDDDKFDMVFRGSLGYWTDTTIPQSPYLKLDDTNRIYMVNQAAVLGSTVSNERWISIYDHTTSTAATAAQITSRLKSHIDTWFSADYTATIGDSPYTGETNAVLSITRVANGNDSKNPKFLNWQGNAIEPLIINTFVGYQEGAGTVGMSAGDKVQHLWGVLNNSQDGGRGGFDDELRGGGDYIIGIQIPFESMVNAASGEKYSAVNHFMTTGSYYLHKPDRKGVENATLAGVQFSDAKNSYTGIKGGVDKATFVRLGGEPLYQFTIIFLPADVIL